MRVFDLLLSARRGRVASPGGGGLDAVARPGADGPDARPCAPRERSPDRIIPRRRLPPASARRRAKSRLAQPDPPALRRPIIELQPPAARHIPARPGVSLAARGLTP